MPVAPPPGRVRSLDSEDSGEAGLVGPAPPQLYHLRGQLGSSVPADPANSQDPALLRMPLLWRAERRCATPSYELATARYRNAMPGDQLDRLSPLLWPGGWAFRSCSPWRLGQTICGFAPNLQEVKFAGYTNHVVFIVLGPRRNLEHIFLLRLVRPHQPARVLEAHASLPAGKLAANCAQPQASQPVFK